MERLDKKLEELKCNSFSGEKDNISALDIIIFSEISLVLALGNLNAESTKSVMTRHKFLNDWIIIMIQNP
jgi:hypothetical protein